MRLVARVLFVAVVVGGVLGALGGPAGEAFAAHAADRGQPGALAAPTSQRSTERSRTGGWTLPITAGWWYVALVPLAAGWILATRAGRNRLARACGLALVLVPTLLAVAPVARATPLPLARQPFPDTREYADVARNLARGNGFLTTVHGDEAYPPRYPPGFPLALAPFSLFETSFPAGAQLGARVFAAGYVLAATGTAWVLGGPLAGGLTALLVGTSPFARQSATMIMSDAFAAGLTIVLAALIHRGATSGARLAGLLAGALVVVRVSAVVNLGALILSSPRRRWPQVMSAAAPHLLGLALVHWLVFGSPLRTGYDYWLPGLKAFDLAYATDNRTIRDGALFADALGGRLMAWACSCPARDAQASLPHLWFYPAVMLGLFWVFAPPLATVPGLILAWRRRAQPSAAFALWLAATSVPFYLVYFYQATRFMAAPATLLAVFSAVWAAELVERLASGLAVARLRLRASGFRFRVSRGSGAREI